MADHLSIACPHCKKKIELTEAMAGPALATARSEERESVRKEMQTSTDKLIAEERQNGLKMVVQLQELTGKLAVAQEAQARAMRLTQELEDAKRELTLTVEKTVGERLVTVRESARKEADEANRLRIAEFEQEKASMGKKIEELQQKVTQGSQQTQGEVMEMELESKLRASFPQDEIVPVPKGVMGGDITQTVLSPHGKSGVIMWELKRTKNWSGAWLAKLRNDQRQAKADIAIMVSFALPDGVQGFGFVDGVWVVHPSLFVPLCVAVRSELIAIHSAMRSMDGMKTKAEQVYEYLVGVRFKQRVSAVIEAFSILKKDLDAEKKSTQRLWSKREETLDRVLMSTAGMYGDLQAIAGQKLGEIEGLSLEQIEAKT